MPPGMIVMMDAKKAADVDSIVSIIDPTTYRATHTETADRGERTMPETDSTWGNIVLTDRDARELARRTAAQIQDIAYIFERGGHYRITGRAATDLEGWTLVGAYGPDGTW